MSYFAPAQGFEEKPLKHLCNLNPEVLSENTEADQEFNYIDIGSVTHQKGIVSRERMTFANSPSRARKPVKEGDIIISTVRTYLRAIAQVDAHDSGSVVSTGFAVCRAKGGVDGRFLHAALQSPPFIEQVVARSVGVSYPAINPSTLGDIKIPMPDLPTQKRIAAFLDRETARIDELIAKKERLVEVLRAKWNASLTHLLTKGLHERGTVSSGNRWISDIPEHWKLVRLKHFLANDGAAIKPGPFGSDLRSSDMEGDYATVINQRAVLDNDFSRKGVAVSKEKYEALRAFSVKAGDILLTSRGTIGRATIAPENVERAIIHPCVIRVRLDKRKVIPKYFLQLLKESAFLEQVLDLSNATTIEVIYGNVLGEVAFPVPPIAEQEAISIEIEKASTRTQDAEKAIIASIDRLREYRAALITSAVTGQIDVDTYGKTGSTSETLDRIEEEMQA